MILHFSMYHWSGSRLAVVFLHFSIMHLCIMLWIYVFASWNYSTGHSFILYNGQTVILGWCAAIAAANRKYMRSSSSEHNCFTSWQSRFVACATVPDRIGTVILHADFVGQNQSEIRLTINWLHSECTRRDILHAQSHQMDKCIRCPLLKIDID